MTNTPDPRFDGLAENYERTRPRYPAELFSPVVPLLPEQKRPVVVDAGAGTGIALEALLPLLPDTARVHAVDISSDMIHIGKEKFTNVMWEQNTAEGFLSRLSRFDLVVAAQAYQWMDRSAYLAAAALALRPGGICLVVQNNRDHAAGRFAEAYENLLEELSPGYSRSYRAIDIEQELATKFDRVQRHAHRWLQRLRVDDFVAMSSSSTQAQRAIAAVGPVFLERVRALCLQHHKGGVVEVPYQSEAFYGIARGETSPI